MYEMFRTLFSNVTSPLEKAQLYQTDPRTVLLMDAASLTYPFKGQQLVTKKAGKLVFCFSQLIEKICRPAVLLIFGVNKPWKKVAIDQEVRKKIHCCQSEIILRGVAGAERHYYWQRGIDTLGERGSGAISCSAVHKTNCNLQGDKTGTKTRILRATKTSVVFKAAISKLRHEHMEHRVLQLVILRNVKNSEEPFVDYGIRVVALVA